MQEPLQLLVLGVLGTFVGGWLLQWVTGLPFRKAWVLFLLVVLAGGAALYKLQPVAVSKTGQKVDLPPTPIPSPPPPAQPVAARAVLEELVGELRSSSEVSRFESGLGPSTPCPAGGDCLSFLDSGVDLAFDRNGYLEKIVVYADRSAGYRPYDGALGALPQGLHVRLTRNEVNAILREPTYGDDLWYEYDYGRYNLCLSFDSEGHIVQVSIVRPESHPTHPGGSTEYAG